MVRPINCSKGDYPVGGVDENGHLNLQILLLVKLTNQNLPLLTFMKKLEVITFHYKDINGNTIMGSVIDRQDQPLEGL